MLVPVVRSSVSALSRVSRRPTELVERTRWLFCLLAAASTVLVVPAVVGGAHPVTATVVLGALGGLIAGWVRRYRRRRTGLLDDLLEVGLLTLATASAAVPAMVLGALFPALWGRSVYGSAGEVARHAVLLVVGVAAAVPLWSLFPGHDGGAEGAAVVGALPIVLLTAAGARHLAAGLFARGQAQRRDAVVNDLGRALLGVTDRREVVHRVLAAADELCRVTPGLWTVRVTATPAGVVHEESTGVLRTGLPPVLPGVVLPLAEHAPGAEAPPVAVDPGPALVAATDPRARWQALPLQETATGWLLIGAAGRPAEEGVSGVRAVVHLTVLALQAADRHTALAEQARTDSLTGLANRAAFTEELERCERDGVAVGVVFVDLDRFKEVNDTHGHAAGDELLRAVGRRLTSVLRPGDVVARLGGDEFAVVLRAPEPGVTEALARRVSEAVAAPLVVAGAVLVPAASTGVAHGDAGEAAEAVVHRADAAMYRTKGARRARASAPA
ncbi:diguanylate cyclase domain-containing protein [Kineococcus sp. SYSU DK004]|uniref:diguanylate cyclase domain-containing protein n=1 Tax=Kineococcus sp. SYSU DK004 TaxID=3383125 RepID=UPI003D7E742B